MFVKALITYLFPVQLAKYEFLKKQNHKCDFLTELEPLPAIQEG